MTDGKVVVGLFAEGSHVVEGGLDVFRAMWTALAAHCGHPIELRVFGIDKKQLVRMKSEAIPVRPAATDLVRTKMRTLIVGGFETLDVRVAHCIDRENLDRVVIAFDAYPRNQFLTAAEGARACQMRAEVSFLLEHLANSAALPTKFKTAAGALRDRYASDNDLTPRAGALGPLEVVFMDPKFEAAFVRDERLVLRALEFKSRPKDWPKFKTLERELDKVVLDPAVECRTKRAREYLKHKSSYGLKFVSAAAENSPLWQHPILTRLCRVLA